MIDRLMPADDSPLDGSDLQIWTGEQIPTFCHSPLLLARLRSWRQYAQRDLPNLWQMYASEEEGALEEAMLLLQQGSDFIYVFQGSESARKYGRVLRGAVLSKLSGSLTAKMLNLYNGCLREFEPYYAQFNSGFSLQHVCWERLVLPLVADGTGSARFVLTYSQPLDDKLEILTSVFERSPVGMIAAAAALGDRQLGKARITLINNRAREILKLPAASDVLHTVDSLRQWIREVIGWTQLGEPPTIETGRRQTLRFQEQLTGQTYMIVIEPVGRFVVFHFLPTN